MTPERHRRISKVYQDALEWSAAERAAFLAQSCGDDEDLRREVESLLSAHDEAGGYFDAPAMEVAARLLAEEEIQSGSAPVAAAGGLVGRVLKRYEFLSLIGVGGMGEVYRAHDAPVWSPDGRRIVFAWQSKGVGDLFEKTVDDGGNGTLLFSSAENKGPLDFTENSILKCRVTKPELRIFALANVQFFLANLMSRAQNSIPVSTFRVGPRLPR